MDKNHGSNRERRLQSLRCNQSPKLSNITVFRVDIHNADTGEITHLDGFGVMRSKYTALQKVVIWSCAIIISWGIVVMIYYLVVVAIKLLSNHGHVSHAILIVSWISIVHFAV
jgi:hypothetical protein